MSMKILGILGSPCADGNTAVLLDAVLEGAREAGAQIERIDVTNLRIDPCDGCRKCDVTGVCGHAGDDMRVIYKKIREVDALVLASPVFFMGVSAQLKALIDRCQCFWIERFVMGHRYYEGKRHPKGLFVSAAGSPKLKVFDPAIQCVKALFIALDYSYAGEILLPDTDSSDIAERRKPIVERAREAGKGLVR
jgi:multimeric flavodoxin WrbA